MVRDIVSVDVIAFITSNVWIFSFEGFWFGVKKRVGLLSAVTHKRHCFFVYDLQQDVSGTPVCVSR